MTLATADDHKTFELDYATSDACTVCGALNGGLEHLIVHCSKLCEIRKCSPIANLLPHLPPAVLRGIPPAMGTEVVGPYWKEEGTTQQAMRQWNDYRKVQPRAAASQFINELPEEDQQLNARKVMHKNRSNFALIGWELPPKALEQKTNVSECLQ